jgi:hypothetical protein
MSRQLFVKRFWLIRDTDGMTVSYKRHRFPPQIIAQRKSSTQNRDG